MRVHAQVLMLSIRMWVSTNLTALHRSDPIQSGVPNSQGKMWFVSSISSRQTRLQYIFCNHARCQPVHDFTELRGNRARYGLPRAVLLELW